MKQYYRKLFGILFSILLCLQETHAVLKFQTIRDSNGKQVQNDPASFSLEKGKTRNKRWTSFCKYLILFFRNLLLKRQKY